LLFLFKDQLGLALQRKYEVILGQKLMNTEEIVAMKTKARAG